MKKRVSRLIVLLIMFAAGSSLADGGDWKMGPFGPYWEDNDWPEFTPMYWMEEFMNRLDDDDDEIREWMLGNQLQGQNPATSTPGAFGPGGAYPNSGWNAPGNSQYSWAPYALNNPWANPWTNPYAVPYGGIPGNDWRSPAYPPAGVFSGPYSERGGLPRLTREEYSSMPRELQREYRRAFEREYYSRNRKSPVNKRRSLPNLTPEEFARMPRERQLAYKRAFDREYTRYRALEARKREMRHRALRPRN